MAKTKKIPTSTSSAFVPNVTDRWTTLPAEGSFCSRFCSPTKNSCLIPVECFAFWFSSCCEVGTPPIAWSTWSIARGTTSQSSRASTASTAR